MATGASPEIVDIPPMGFSFQPIDSAGRRHADKRHPLLVDQSYMRNEFFEAEVDEETGGIRGIQFYNRRGNLLAQQLAMRVADPRRSRSGSSRARYTRMVADKQTIVENSSSCGVVRSAGRLLHDDGRQLAQFVQTLRIARGNPILEIDVEIQPGQLPQAEPWEEYFASRWAWSDESATLSTYLNEARYPTGRNKVIAPLAVDIDHFRFTTSILTGGLPFHRRIGYRRLDTLLIVRGEQRRQFKMAVGIDLKYPVYAALDLLCPVLRTECEGPGTEAGQSGWLFHLNCKNVVALDWEAIDDFDNQAADSETSDLQPPALNGVQIVLKETEGRSADLKLTCCRPIRTAHRIDLCGHRLHTLAVDKDTVQIEMASRETVQIELLW